MKNLQITYKIKEQKFESFGDMGSENVEYVTIIN